MNDCKPLTIDSYTSSFEERGPLPFLRVFEGMGIHLSIHFVEQEASL